MERIAFDELGNTGNDLIAAEQPVFCLASVRIKDAELAEVTKLLALVRATEWKFSKMRRNPSQLSLLVKLLNMDWVTPETVKLFVIFKNYMVVTKLVDLIHEPSARAFGINLYERGAARGLANLLTLTLPTYVGRTRADRLLKLFVELVRRKDDAALDRFHREAVSTHAYLVRHYPDSDGLFFAPIILACREPASWVPHLQSSELDPLIPAYHTLADAWGKTLNEQFIILADESETLAQEREILLRFSDPDLREHTVGSPTRNIAFPFRVADVVVTRSDTERRVQVADLFAGMGAYAFAPQANRLPPPDEFCGAFVRGICDRVWVDGIIPSADVTPEQLRMEDYVGVDPVEYSARILRGDPETRK